MYQYIIMIMLVQGNNNDQLNSLIDDNYSTIFSQLIILINVEKKRCIQKENILFKKKIN